MANTSRGLGKGLGALLGDAALRTDTSENLHLLPVSQIERNADQPRRIFDETALDELAESIREHGILQPLTVRQKGERFELIAGERRLRAARMAGLNEVPCIVMDVDMESSGVIALIENIQRRDLDFVEEAEGISRLIRLFGLSQEQTARRLGKSQSAVANKLRLLRLPKDVLERLRTENLSERHARALLRLPDAQAQRQALERMIDRRMNVAAAEAYVDTLCAPPQSASADQQLAAPTRRRSVFLMKDVRLFLNTMDRSVDLMRSGGVAAELRREETDDALIVTVRIEKR